MSVINTTQSTQVKNGGSGSGQVGPVVRSPDGPPFSK